MRFEPAPSRFWWPGKPPRSCARRPAGSLGFVGLVAPASPKRAALRARTAIFVAELDLDILVRMRRTAQRRGSAAAAASVRRARSVDRRRRHLACGDHSWHHSGGRRATAAAPLVAIAFFDRYKGKGVPEGAVSLSVRLTFQAADRTLTDAEVQQSVDTILAALVASTAQSALTQRFGSSRHGENSDHEAVEHSNRSIASRRRSSGSSSMVERHEGRAGARPKQRTSGWRARSKRLRGQAGVERHASAPSCRRSRKSATSSARASSEMLEQLEALNL